MPVYTLDARTATPHFPGIGRYVSSLAAHLPAHLTDDESLILLTPGASPLSRPVDAHGALRVTTVEADASPFSLSQQWAIPRLLRRIQAARGPRLLYHSPYYLMPYRTPCPAILTIYDTIALTLPETVTARARSLFRLTTELALRASGRIITISNATRRDLLAHFNVNPAIVTTIHLAADEAFSPRPVAEQQRLRAALDLRGAYLLYVGSNKPHKNLVRLIDAYAMLRHAESISGTATPDLVIAGAWDPRFPDAKQRAAQHSVEDCVRFLGPVDDKDLPALYSAAMAFVFPSRYEGFGLPVLEAMSCGAPVACSHTSSLPEVAGDAAHYFDPNDAESIADSLHDLVTNEALRRRLRECGIARARRFSWSETAAQTLTVYRRLT